MASVSPSSTSAPSLPFSPFKLLPDELTQYILDRVTPAPFPSSLYDLRLTFFLSLRLVSKDFKSYAESRLLEVIKMHYDGRKLKSDLGSLLSILGKTGLDSTITIKVLILENLSPQTDTKIESLGELWKDGQLEELEYRSKIKNRKREYIEEGDLKSFSWFTAFLGSSITRLHLQSVAIPDSVVFAFPVLENLSFRDVALPHESNFLYKLPRVRRFTTMFNNGVFYFLEALLPKLESFSIPLLERQRLPIHLALHRTPCIIMSSLTTFDSRIFLEQQADIKHLRLGGYSQFLKPDYSVLNGPWPQNSLQNWVEAVQKLPKSPSLRTIRIADQMQPQNEKLPEPVRLLLARLENVSLEKGIEIIRAEDIV